VCERERERERERDRETETETKREEEARRQWLTPIILTTQEAEIRRIEV
jgi:hypothetical protein